MRVMGIDLGFRGAIAIMDEDYLDVKDMPTQKIEVNKKERVKLDVPKLCSIMSTELPHVECVFVEKVHPIMVTFGQGSGASNFHLGYCLGVMEAILNQYCLYKGVMKYVLITPQEWQKYFGIKKPKGDKNWNVKVKAFEVAKKLFPTVELATKRGRILDGRSDSLLIAKYGKERYGF